MNHPETFRINEPHVIAEEIEGEAIILNFESGTYYSLNESAMLIWRSIQAGYPSVAIVDQWQECYQADRKQVAAEFDGFMQQLLAEQLIVPAPQSTPVAPIPTVDGTPYERPILNKFTDLQNLLLLDPIHEVNEMGWPHPAP